MDFTKRYIKQCEKAKELQEYKRQKGWKTGDWCYDEYRGDLWRIEPSIWLICGGLKCNIGLHNTEYWDTPSPSAIWLPTQDQLQEIVEILADRDFINRYMSYFANRVYFHTDDPTSWEQFWLAYVMWELYGKVWDDKKEDWVKQEVQDDQR